MIASTPNEVNIGGRTYVYSHTAINLIVRLKNPLVKYQAKDKCHNDKDCVQETCDKDLNSISVCLW